MEVGAGVTATNPPLDSPTRPMRAPCGRGVTGPGPVVHHLGILAYSQEAQNLTWEWKVLATDSFVLCLLGFQLKLRHKQSHFNTL